ncbi:MAG: ABC transporter substrate-binding protein [Candidatus Microgenomates bacterium]
MLKTLRRYYWLTQVFIKKHASIILKSAGIILTILTTIIIFARYLPTPKETVKIGRIGKYTLATIPQDIESQIGEGLVTVGKNGEITGALASSWIVEDDGKRYTFTLNQKKFWHDGTSVKAEDISYNFTDVEVTRNDNTIIYSLKEPFAPFMQAMTKPILKNDTLGTKEARITDYHLVSGNTLQTLTLETNNTRIIYKFYPTENSALTAYKLGEVNMLDSLSTIPQDLATDQSSTIIAQEGDKIAALFINNSDNLLNSKTTRQGLAYAIPDKSFGKVRALSPISRSSWAYNDLVKDYEYDESRAKTLFTQDAKNPSEIKLELKTMLPYLDVAESIASSWRQVLGIMVDVKVVSSVNSDYQIILADFTPPKDPDQYTLWHSTQATNFTKYSNLKVDKLLEDGRRTLDQKLREEIYSDFQRFLLEDSPTIFLFETEKFTLSRKKLF